MARKKEILAQVALRTGLTRLLEGLRSRPALLVLNYHRVGDSGSTPYDPGTFSCTTEEFSWQVNWLRQHHPVLSLAEALDIVHGRTTPSVTSVLITFDDGYLDNFEQAFPVLQEHGAPATFFLPTSFVGTNRLPWWDEIAYLVKRSSEPRLSLTYPRPAEFHLPDGDRSPVLVAVLDFYKQAGAIDTVRFLEELALTSGVLRPGEHAARCFMSWDEARTMQAAGMSFGSHTHTHEILSRLPFERQMEELETSRSILEQELGGEVDTLAYPNGKANTFSEETVQALQAARYKTAFSFYFGINRPGAIDPFDVLREAVGGESRPHFRLRQALFASAGRGLD